jgi:hypothetical protein
VLIDALPRRYFSSPAELGCVADRGKRRHRPMLFDFDSRAASLPSQREALVQSISHSFGPENIDRKVQNFRDMGTKPFSIVAHHNPLFDDVRSAFVAGAYYSALVGACALGERILNHLLIDFRDDFRASPEFKKVHSKASFDDWGRMIQVLKAWDVLLPEALVQFQRLEKLRNRSIHFNEGLPLTVRSDALAAIGHMRAIVGSQFGWFGNQPWFIEGIAGTAFIKRQYETNPFVRRYILPQSPFVGVLYGFGSSIFEVADLPDYGDGELSDEQFAIEYMTRDPKSVVGNRIS